MIPALALLTRTKQARVVRSAWYAPARSAGDFVILLLCVSALGCRARRDDAQIVAYRGEIQPLLEARCASCHNDARHEGGYNVASYLDAIGCAEGDRPATLPRDASPFETALARADHATLVNDDERTQLLAWVRAGTPLGRGVHGDHWLDPRASDFHGAFLRSGHYRAITDTNDADYCGRCHGGLAAQETISAPGANACGTCHREPEGVFACNTCHRAEGGSGDRARRSACFFPNENSGSHDAHLRASDTHAQGYACSTCHPTPSTTLDAKAIFTGTHADGYLEVWFDRSAGRLARFDAESRRCSDTCHANGGARPAPTWGDAPMRCGDCHGAPPSDHYVGACSSCHAEANAEGTTLSGGALHLNGIVDRGDGSGTCGSCHGSGDSPWPSSGAHAAHRAPNAAVAVACETCHAIPSAEAHPRGGAVRVQLSSRAGRSAHYDATDQSCKNTACHAARGGEVSAPRWNQGASARACGACHSVPPPAPHPATNRCDGASCHGQSVINGAITPIGAAHHVDGRLDFAL